MITAVKGKINGIEIDLYLDPDTQDWVIDVPASLDGVYIVEIFAYNDLGYQAYTSVIKVLLKEGRIVGSSEIRSYREENAVKKGGIAKCYTKSMKNI